MDILRKIHKSFGIETRTGLINNILVYVPPYNFQLLREFKDIISDNSTFIRYLNQDIYISHHTHYLTKNKIYKFLIRTNNSYIVGNFDNPELFFNALYINILKLKNQKKNRWKIKPILHNGRAVRYLL